MPLDILLALVAVLVIAYVVCLQGGGRASAACAPRGGGDPAPPERALRAGRARAPASPAGKPDDWFCREGLYEPELDEFRGDRPPEAASPYDGPALRGGPGASDEVAGEESLAWDVESREMYLQQGHALAAGGQARSASGALRGMVRG